MQQAVSTEQVTVVPDANRRINVYRDSGAIESYEMKEMTFRVQENGVAMVELASPQNLNTLSPNKRMEMFSEDHILAPEPIVQEYSRRKMAPDLKHDSAFVRETVAFWDTHKPMIVAVNGLTLGAGGNMVFANFFDITFCSTKATFKWPFVDIGLTPELGSSLVLPFMAGLTKTKEIMFTGDWFSAQQMDSFGLVNAILEPDELMPHALAFAARLAEKDSAQLQLSKKLINANLRASLENTLRLESETNHLSLLDFGGVNALKKRRAKM